MDLLDALSQTFDHATKIVAGVQDDQLDLSTPCQQWNVRTLLSHTVGVVANIGRGAGGRELLADTNSFPLENDRGAQFRAEADRTLAPGPLAASTARSTSAQGRCPPKPA